MDHAAMARSYMKPETMSHDDLATRMRHNGAADGMLHEMLQHNPITPDHVILTLHHAVKQGMMSPDEAGTVFNKIPTHPDHARMAITDLHHVVKHAGSMLAQEHAKRLDAA